MNCGKQLKDGSRFCPCCGTDLSIVAELNARESEATCYQPAPEATYYQAPVQQPAPEATYYQAPVQQPAPEATYYQPPVQQPAYEADAAYYQPVQQSAPQPRYEPAPRPQYQPAPQPGYAPAPAPAAPPRRKKKRKGLAIGLSITLAVLLLAGAAAFLFLSGVFAGPNAAVGNALRKSSSAYTKAAEFMPKYDLSGLKEQKGYSSILTAKLHELNVEDVDPAVLSMLKTASLKINHDFSETKRESALSITPRLGTADLLTASVTLDDSTLAVTCPEILGETTYGANTETIGADIYNLGILGPEDQPISYIGFNLFDLIQELRAVLEETKVDEALMAEYQAAVLAMFTEAEIEKLGKEEIDVNGTDIECIAYSVLIPEDAIADVFDLYRDIVRSIDSEDLARDMTETILSGIISSEELVDEAMASFEYTDTTDEMLDEIKEFLKELGDLECTVWLADGYVRSVHWEDTLYDEDMELTVDLGGDGDYTDMLGIEFRMDDTDVTVTLESSGDHSAKNGTYTDETVIEIEGNGESLVFTFETEFDPDTGEFTLDADADEIMAVSLRGALTGGENTFDLNLDRISVAVEGEELISCGLSLAVSPYEQRVSVTNPTMLSTLTEEDLYDIADELSAAAQQWAIDLITQYPELMTMFF